MKEERVATRHTRPTPRLFFDIETVAMPDVESFVGEPKVDSRIKDPAKIATAREEKIADMIAKAPLDADLATVKLLSMGVGLDGPTTIVLVPSKKLTKPATAKMIANCYERTRQEVNLVVTDERGLLEHFWKNLAMCSSHCVGYNILGFDLPFILRRSMDHSLLPGVTVQLAKYKDQPTTDLFALLSGWSWDGAKRLKWVANRYGLEVLAEGADGSQVADMSDEDLVVYGLSDLHVTRQLYRRMNGIYFNHYGVGEE